MSFEVVKTHGQDALRSNADDGLLEHLRRQRLVLEQRFKRLGLNRSKANPFSELAKDVLRAATEGVGVDLSVRGSLELASVDIVFSRRRKGGRIERELQTLSAFAI